MPAIAWGMGVLGTVVGFTTAKGTSGIGTIVKWGVIGGGVYVGAKALKVI